MDGLARPGGLSADRGVRRPWREGAPRALGGWRGRCCERGGRDRGADADGDRSASARGGDSAIANAHQFAADRDSDRDTATPSPSRVERSGSARVLDRGPATRPFVALTFDAGSDAGYTAQILDVLHAQGVTASFGITGRWAEQNPELLRRIVREGHHLINHTYDHDSLTGLSTNAAPMTRTQRWSELDRTADAVRQIAGVDIGPYFRPPYGDYDASVNADVYARGYDYNVMWTVDSLGWRGISADEIVARCLANAQPGAIYIFHVGSASQDGNALDRIIAGLRRSGYGMGSVPQLLGS
ncbi:MAG: polysaccharide deacetylase family protein [Dehalococcoidia bacterium]